METIITNKTKANVAIYIDYVNFETIVLSLGEEILQGEPLESEEIIQGEKYYKGSAELARRDIESPG